MSFNFAVIRESVLADDILARARLIDSALNVGPAEIRQTRRGGMFPHTSKLWKYYSMHETSTINNPTKLTAGFPLKVVINFHKSYYFSTARACECLLNRLLARASQDCTWVYFYQFLVLKDYKIFNEFSHYKIL